MCRKKEKSKLRFSKFGFFSIFFFGIKVLFFVVVEFRESERRGGFSTVDSIIGDIFCLFTFSWLLCTHDMVLELLLYETKYGELTTHSVCESCCL